MQLKRQQQLWIHPNEAMKRPKRRHLVAKRRLEEHNRIYLVTGRSDSDSSSNRSVKMLSCREFGVVERESV